MNGLNERQVDLMLQLAKTGKVDELLQLFGGGGGIAPRQKQLTETLLYGRGGLFTICASDQLVNASLNDQGLAAHIPWVPTTAEVRRQAVITTLGDLEGTAQPEDQCADPPGSSWRGCEIQWCLGRIRARSPEYDRLDQGLRWCEKVPRFRLFGNVTIGGKVVAPQGSQIMNDAEWGAVTAAVHIRQTLGQWMYTAHPTTNSNMFYGLQTLVNTGYTDLKTQLPCPGVDAEVKNWGCANVLNDAACALNIYQYLDSVVQRIVQRSVGAGLGVPNPGDMRIVAPSFIIDKLFEFWACNIGPCGTGGATPAQVGTAAQMIDVGYGRQMADNLRSRGVLRVRGMDIPVIEDDYMPFTHPASGVWCADIYVLTLQVGGMPLVFGEYQDFRQGVGDAITGYSTELYGGRVVDDGRFYAWQERTNTCFDTRLALKPRIVVLLPFLQGRITDVAVRLLQEPVVPIPTSPYSVDGGSYEASYDYECGE